MARLKNGPDRSSVYLFFSLVALLGLFLFYYNQEQPAPQQKCGIEQCHGLDITCGANVPDACTLEYQLGDKCRQYAKCAVIAGNCQLLPDTRFDQCKACVEQCKKLVGPEAFSCEEKC